MTNKLETFGRIPPPREYQFLPGKSGFPQGKRKGTISTKKLTRKVAMKKHRVKLDGQWQFLTLRDLVILKVRSMAMAGRPAAATLLEWVRELVQPGATAAEGGFLIVPERAKSNEEYEKMMESYSRNSIEPGSEEWYRRQNAPRIPPKPKPVLDPSSPLAKALQEFHHRWDNIPFEFRDTYDLRNLGL